MATSKEVIENNLTGIYGTSLKAGEAYRRIKSGQYTAQDTQNFANATGVNDAAARISGANKPVDVSATPRGSVAREGLAGTPVNPVVPVAPVATVAPVQPAPSPLVPVATAQTGVVERPGVSATISGTAAPSFNTGSSDADRFISISSKSQTDLTDDDRAFLRQVNAKAAIMGGVRQALGMDGNTFGGNRVEATADGFTLYGADGVARPATAAEAESLRRSAIGQNAVKVFQENQLIAGQKTAAEKSMAAEEARRQDANQKNMTAYEQALRATADKSIATLREQGQKRKDALQNSFSAMGGGRSTDAMRSLDDVQKAIDDQVQLEEAKYSAQVQAYLLQQQGADAEALKPYRDAISSMDLQLGQAQATAFKRMQELNEEGAATNEQALKNLMGTLTTQAQSELGMAGFDEDNSVKLGYFAKKDGTPIVGKNGEPIQFKSQKAETAKPVKIGEDAKGRDIMGVYNSTSGKYEPLAYGVGAGASGGGIGGGVRSTVGSATSQPPATLTASQRAQIDALKGEYFTDKARDTLANAGISQSQLDAYVTEGEVGPEMALKIGQILTVIPVQLRNSEAEQKNFQKQAKLLLKQGKDIVGAQRAILGQVLPDNVTDEQKDALRGALSYIDQLPGEAQTGIVRAIKNGDVATAIKSLESSYMKEKGDGKFNEATAIKTVRMTNDLEEMINKFQDKFGPISGRWDKLKTKFADNPEAQALISRMTAMTAKMRNELSGTAVTASEGEFLDPVIVSLNDQPANAIEKLATLRDSVLNGYNAEREAAGLPRIDQKALLNGKERVKAYTAMAKGEEYVPADVNQVVSGNIAPQAAASGKTYKVTDVDGTTEEVTAQDFAKQLNEQLSKASPEQKAAVIANAKAYAEKAGIPASEYDPLGIF